MQNITIARYQASDFAGVQLWDEDGVPIQELAAHYAGYIEGVRDDGSTWIMYLDAQGSPEIYWARRDEDGGVIGDGTPLTR